MVYCSECGKKLKDDSKFCIECGNNTDKKIEEELAKNIKDFTKKTSDNLERNAERLGRKIETIGKRIEKKFEGSSKSFENWHDRYFGILGPLIGSFLGLIILRIIIELMALRPIDLPIMAKTSELLYPYQLLFFGLMLLTSYSNYFSRKFKLFKLITPIPSAISFTVGIWILSTIYNELYKAFENFPNFTIISDFIINNIIIIFVIVLLLGYLVNIISLYNSHERQEEENIEE